MRTLVVLALAAGCSSSKNDLCSRAVNHVFELTTVGEVSADERKVVDLAIGAALARCRSEGLSDAEASCILAARGLDWDEGLRACPAFAARPPTWVIVRPSREERIRIFGGTPTPDGPRQGPVSYRSLVGTIKSTCGLDAAGSIQCWGQKIKVPSGTFTELRADDTMVCGLDGAGRVQCASDSDLPLRLPTEPLTDFDIARHRGCGLRKTDGSIVCWNHLDDAGLTPPVGQFVEVALAGATACALGLDERVTCFGNEPLASPPDARFRSIAVANGGICGITTAGTIACFGDGVERLGAPAPGTFRTLDCRRAHCCGVKDDATLSCWGAPHEVYEPPAGKFTSVAVFVRHACAVRAEGGTICWGDNDWGACNVPQR
ncbi:MAG: hypothetical protein H0T65_16855 [Deltaproteobacteria bacterium]|nr:hypothetical protein [Deltaproteobacteria bacterium]